MANDTPNNPTDPKQPTPPEIEPLSDTALEEVSGGVLRESSSDSCCSCTSCS
ncbi:MAG TPA: hypothetical protein VIB39_23520 [Candidatus Angelobacter sp.]